MVFADAFLQVVANLVPGALVLGFLLAPDDFFGRGVTAEDFEATGPLSPS
jgi:hypothetical protein